MTLSIEQRVEIREKAGKPDVNLSSLAREYGIACPSIYWITDADRDKSDFETMVYKLRRGYAFKPGELDTPHVRAIMFLSSTDLAVQRSKLKESVEGFKPGLNHYLAHNRLIRRQSSSNFVLTDEGKEIANMLYKHLERYEWFHD